jgi:hypothetical protein
MTYNVVDDLTKLQITFPFMEVVKIPQQRENVLKILDDTSSYNPRIEEIVINMKQRVQKRLRVNVPPFFISLEKDDFILHSCLGQ